MTLTLSDSERAALNEALLDMPVDAEVTCERDTLEGFEDTFWYRELPAGTAQQWSTFNPTARAGLMLLAGRVARLRGECVRTDSGA